MKKNNIFLILVFLFLLTLDFPLFAATTASRTVTQTISAIDDIGVSGNPATLAITTAVAGSQPTNATDSSTYYKFSTNGTNHKITGKIGSNMAANLTLKVSLAAPTGATSTGSQVLTTTAVDLVTGITQTYGTNYTITYTFSATVAAGQVSTATKTATLTVSA